MTHDDATRAYDCSFLRELGLDDDQVRFDEESRTDHGVDYGTESTEGYAADAVVYPESTEDVSAVLRAANERGVPVTPYAAGTSTEGNPVPTTGGVSLDMTRMSGVIDVRTDDFQADVWAGTLGIDIEERVAEDGLFFPPFPQSRDISTIGGMIANDSSGTKTVKYGEVGDWVREIEVVLADGRVITAGSKAAKTSAGYNLKDLFVGSEGTLGVVTRATLALAPLPNETRAGRATFDTVRDATEAIAEAIRSGVDLATAELVDPETARITNAYTGVDMPDVPTVFVVFHGSSAAGVDAEVERCREVFERHGAREFEARADDDEMDELLRARRQLAHALKEYDPDLSPMAIGDVTVPMGSYPTIIEYARDVADEYDLLIPTFGHAGDGNVHYAVLVDPDDPDHVARGKEASDEIVRRAIELGGTSTGEHGIGIGKRRYMRDEHGDALDVMRLVKDALDPNGTLNPGKVLPDE